MLPNTQFELLNNLQQPALQVTVIFLVYISLDFLWLCLLPASIPKFLNLILLHHLTTFVLLMCPYRYSSFANYTCWDALIELNTWLRLVKHHCPALARLTHWLYWITFIIYRLVIYPCILLRAWTVLKVLPAAKVHLGPSTGPLDYLETYQIGS